MKMFKIKLPKKKIKNVFIALVLGVMLGMMLIVAKRIE